MLRLLRQLTFVPGGALFVAFTLVACHRGGATPNDGGDASAPTDGSATDGSGPNSAWCSQHASTSGTSVSGNDASIPLVFTIDLCKGPARQYDPPTTPAPVSPYIYGINAGSFVATSTKWGLIRQGGDDDTDYNWTNDYSNSGDDFCYYQGVSTMNGNLAGRYSDPTGDTIPAAQAKGIAFLATIPILDYVAAAYDRNTGFDTATNSSDVCPGTDPVCASRSGTLHANVADKFQGDPGFGSTLTFAFANDGTSTPTGSPAFVSNVMSKGSAFCSCAPGTKSCSGCSVGTSPVAEDEFVNFLQTNYGTGGAPLFFQLDNEPNYWISTHPELYPNNCSVGTVTWDDIATRDINAATAIKKVSADAKVFGPVVVDDGMAYGGDYASPHFVAGTVEFSDWYLGQVAAASVSAAKPLIDVFDVHYYTVGTTDAECLEAPRLFWDPDATDISAADTNTLDFNYGDHSYWDQYWYPRQVIPRLFKKIASAYSGKSTAQPALSFSEYNAGCETAISGGVAQADLLGIFGREGVFAAMAWPLQAASANYLEAAFALYRDYDGSGSVVGDTSVHAATTDYRNTSVYAFSHSTDITSAEVVAINKLSTAEPVTIQIVSSPTFHTATLYNLIAGAAAVSAASGAAPAVTCASDICTVTFTMPATSATTVVLR
jgi:Glycoside hydrolase family 44